VLNQWRATAALSTSPHALSETVELSIRIGIAIAPCKKKRRAPPAVTLSHEHRKSPPYLRDDGRRYSVLAFVARLRRAK